ncbi:MAG: AMP-binding protein [Pigmentiphaga sp.]|uniref:class I adenylate-forming enzyme family protein n=1 Tax=Pigmentiphaga sp. TaxID=1977564 RepID=UPI0029B8D7DA|nr:AMP-binding protein [Pigmentiphaga sp.]MDX3906128.1 AMP-binding protein [Pigmentiphaga sp.]
MTRQDALLQFAGQDLATLLARKATERSRHPFLIWAPEPGVSRTWTYAEFADQAARLAGGLQARGIGAGDRVLMHLENCPAFLLTYFACAHLGAVCVPTNAMAAGPELAYFAELTGSRGAITQPKFADKVRSHCGGLAWLAVTEDDAGQPADPATAPPPEERYARLLGNPAPARTPDAAAPLSVLFTSGTTSRPKGVLWTHANALWAGRLGALQQGLRSDDIYQVFLPLFHVVGLSWSVFPALWAGASVVLQPRFSASRYWPVALEHRSTVGSHVIFSANVLAGMPAPPGHAFRQWCNALWQPEHETHFGLKMMGAWGMTEMVAQGIVTDPWSPPRAGAIGRASPGYGVRIVDDRGRDCRPGERGHLLIRGIPGVTLFAEYFGNAQATRDAFDDDGYFKTGDSVLLHDDGSIQFGDRAKDLLKVGGEGVSAAEIERVIRSVPEVGEVAVVGRPDPAYGEVPVAFVRLAAGGGAPAGLSEAIIETCRKELAKYKVPRDVVFVDDFPRIGVGKISKARLRELAAAPSA